MIGVTIQPGVKQLPVVYNNKSSSKLVESVAPKELRMRRFGSFCTGLIGLAGSAATLVTAYGYWYPRASHDAKPAIIFLSSYTAALMIALVWREAVYSRKARYAEIVASFGQTFLAIQESALSSVASTNEINLGCKRIATHAAHVFSLTTGTECSVCIKVLEDDLSDESRIQVRPRVRTLCRDQNSEGKRDHADKSQGDHWLDQNTDFYELHRNAGGPKGRSFFSNNLPGYHGYNNSSFELYGRPHRGTLLINLFPAMFWKLPYRSTIVVPVSSRQSDSNKTPLVGYVCVDSGSRGVFNRRYDPELLAGIAECLYPVLVRFCDLTTKNVKETQ